MRLLILILVSFGLVQAQSSGPLRLEKTISMPGVRGRIDHMSIDTRNHRLFVAALGNNTVEVIDVSHGKRLHSIPGLDEPQGVLYLPRENRLYVANGGDGTVRIFDGTSYRQLGAIDLGSDADDVRFDPVRRLIYVGYGSGALAAIRPSGTRAGTIGLDAHPESFQIETNGTRIFVNLPDSRKLAVIDKRTRRVIANWKTDNALDNFPMALDEKDHRLFVVCRRPAELIVLDTDSGKIVAKLPAVGDCDDLFYDSARKLLYASGGEGAVWVFQQRNPDRYDEVAKVPTRRGARTSLFSPELDRLYVAARQQGSEPAAIRIYSTQ